MLDLEAITQRTKDLWTLNAEDRRKMDEARDDIKALIGEVQTLRMKVEIYTKHARMGARKAAARC